MILTVTPNPSVDLLFATDRLVWDDANRIASPRRRAGGQGINVTRAVLELGGPAQAIALLGGATGAELAGMLDSEGVSLLTVPIDGETRVFVGVREASTSRSLLLNPRGPLLTESDGHRLLEAVALAARGNRPRWLVCSGSLPPGLAADVYARLGDTARACGAAFAVDCDGEPLAHAARSGCDVLSPNAHEAERLLGQAAGSIDSPGAAASAAREMIRRFGPRVACVTLGAAGAVAADDNGAWAAAAFDEGVGTDATGGGSAVGAGDAFLAALLLALEGGESLPDALRSGVAAGSAVLRSRGSALLRRADHAAALQKTNARRIE